MNFYYYWITFFINFRKDQRVLHRKDKGQQYSIEETKNKDKEKRY